MPDVPKRRPPAGWYKDAKNADRQRFWDGDAWTEQRRPAPHTLDKKGQREQQRADKRLRQKQAMEAANTAAEEMRQLCGPEVISKPFGGKTIRLYKNGYVSVQGLLVAGNYARLLSIEATGDVAKKSGLGRGAAAVMTGGVNLLGSNKRGDVYLTIVTESNTHVLRETPPTVANMQASKALEAAGNGVIAAAAQRASAGPAGPPAGDLRGRLQQLQQLLDDGLVTQQEFDSKRKALLDSL